ncbi:MAG: AraC family transcriptional regulator [Candidatus Pseudobacter hemicellulosilyticus]|uniref:AraC family transcriptional regulator n=1 Tax=Candidatus Pseudobacter hemicellulosilyticus TaxID=3121375 RepID=A0AAJ5WUW5_9BACT|nr:MAG: AraC family transcriptional regulator [Pseudobacter sp.]
MRNYRIKFPAIDLDDDLQQFAHEIGGEITGPGQVQVSGKIAKGAVQRFQFEPGFSLRTWNLLFQDPVDLYKPATQGADSTFSVIYLLTPDNSVLKTIGTHRQFSRQGVRSTLMIADSVPIDIEMVPHHPVQILELNVTAFWLAQQFQKAGLPLESLLERINDLQSPLIMIEPSPASVSLAVNTLFDDCMAKEKNQGQIQQQAAALVISFLEKTIERSGKDIQANNDAHFEKIMEAEAILKAHLQKTLPNVGVIAHQVALSESTLKRHFKVVFGKSVYEYYLSKKMQLAKNLLLERPLTVNETAEILGYEKVSNFIDIFKKHHGYSPGSIKKRGFPSI